MATKRSSNVGLSKKSAVAAASGPVDSRQLMRQSAIQKKLTGTAKKIEHPLARYNKLDQLSCAICLMPVKNEMSWNAHLLSKTHKDNVEKFKRGDNIVAPVSQKQKNVASAMETEESIESEQSPAEETVQEGPPSKLAKGADGEPAAVASSLPLDFFDDAGAEQTEETIKEEEPTVESTTTTTTATTSQLPEGFFDDAKRDAKVRKVKYEDKFESVWSDFQKEIAKETMVSHEIVEEDEDQFFVSKEVVEIDAHMLVE